MKVKSVLGTIVFSKQSTILKIENTILFSIFKIVLKTILENYFQNSFQNYFEVSKIVFPNSFSKQFLARVIIFFCAAPQIHTSYICLRFNYFVDIVRVTNIYVFVCLHDDMMQTDRRLPVKIWTVKIGTVKIRIGRGGQGFDCPDFDRPDFGFRRSPPIVISPNANSHLTLTLTPAGFV